MTNSCNIWKSQWINISTYRVLLQTSTSITAATESTSNNNLQGWKSTGKMKNVMKKRLTGGGPQWLKSVWRDAQPHQRSKKCTLKQQWDITLYLSDWPKLQSQTKTSFWHTIDGNENWNSLEELKQNTKFKYATTEIRRIISDTEN